MAVAYPLDLRTIVRASKTRTQPARFSIASPRRGQGYVQPTGTDTPIFWSVMFRFTTEEAATFREWFANDLNGGIDEFEMPIRTEFGLVTYTLQFLPDGLLDTREVGEVWEYTATVM